ncbi:hypothetical protein [Cellulomonas soli]|uniref:Uncharacterized protein n=1 Tax=Cellulomonas soli TaxID=931535 RepID=A0A512P8Z3_9CELL|nr:hypothetical protein [Cellulomonas soli]NYI57890.1 hypothetical protein [Cellulomonas soli]GEP67674.1 hypothetical protein CSO01_03890 [Cellulomonas soli]
MSSPATPARPGARDRWRRDVYLLRFGAAMQDHPYRQYRRIRAEVRASVDAAAADVGMRRALEDLGAPRRLALAYLDELDRDRPRWTDGAVLGAIIGIGFPAYMFLAYALGAIDTLDAAGGGSVRLSWLGAPVTATSDAGGMSVDLVLSWQGTAVSAGLFALAFALGARVWRLRRH